MNATADPKLFENISDYISRSDTINVIKVFDYNEFIVSVKHENSAYLHRKIVHAFLPKSVIHTHKRKFRPDHITLGLCPTLTVFCTNY